MFRTHSPHHKSNNNLNNRVILLLDLDCFYAQCETIRLGLDRSLPIALLQWNSALAVNYPAREFGIKRGDDFNSVMEKGGGRCVALHLPVVGMNDICARKQEECGIRNANDDCGVDGNDDEVEGGGNSTSVDTLYDREYCLSKDVQLALFAKERNRMRRSAEGKASLERYRLASSKIFSIIQESLLQHVGKENFILERASIDELFLDVSDHCYNFTSPVWREIDKKCSTAQVKSTTMKVSTTMGASTVSPKGSVNDDPSSIINTTTTASEQRKVMKETFVFAQEKLLPNHLYHRRLTHYEQDNDYSNDDYGSDEQDEEVKALIRGCLVAHRLRAAVFDELGFELSAGISINKLVAKLAATYGKPNGQAVVFREALLELMNVTKIRKVRNLGGKIGKKVIDILPGLEDTMGSMRRLLSPFDLENALGSPKTAKSVYDSSMGIDNDPVVATVRVLTKTITSFKSFTGAYLDSALDDWILLLSTDVIRRVDLDTGRNNRYPKTCTISYSYNEQDKRIAKSIRIAFPHFGKNKIKEMTSKVQEALAAKAIFPINRLGLSASDFVSFQKDGGAISSFFQEKKQNIHQNDLEDASLLKKDEPPISTLQCNGDAPTSEAVDIHTLIKKKVLGAMVSSSTDYVPIVQNAESPDLTYALKLQASYDRENRFFSSLDKNDLQKKGTKRINGTTLKANMSKSKKKIDSYFKKK